MTPETKANLVQILQHTTPAALEAEGWTVADFEVDLEQQLRGRCLGLRGTATKAGESVRLLSAEHSCDDRHTDHRIRVTMIRPDHSHVRIVRQLAVVVTAAVIDDGPPAPWVRASAAAQAVLEAGGTPERAGQAYSLTASGEGEPASCL